MGLDFTGFSGKQSATWQQKMLPGGRKSGQVGYG